MAIVDVEEIDVPIDINLNFGDATIGIPAIDTGLPCGFGPVRFAGVSFSASFDLGTIAEVLGIPIPMIALPPICPALLEAAFIAAAIALKKSRGG